MAEINLMDLYPRSKRPIDERGKLATEKHRAIASQLGLVCSDGDRLHSHGGRYYRPRESGRIL